MGLSLDRPLTLIDGKTPLKSPTIGDMREPAYIGKTTNPQASAPFLHQTSSLGATLIFGDKWATFHDFLQRRLQPTNKGLARKQKQLVSTAEPAWSEYLLELVRARGWSNLHPAKSFVTIHDELAQVPEEFLRPPKSTAASKKPQLPDNGRKLDPAQEAFLPISDEKSTAAITRESSDASASGNSKTTPLPKFLPFKGFLPELGALPWLTYTGKTHLRIAVDELTEQYLPFSGGRLAAAVLPKWRRRRKRRRPRHSWPPRAIFFVCRMI
jgi:hypothetical protein